MKLLLNTFSVIILRILYSSGPSKRRLQLSSTPMNIDYFRITILDLIVLPFLMPGQLFSWYTPCQTWIKKRSIIIDLIAWAAAKFNLKSRICNKRQLNTGQTWNFQPIKEQLRIQENVIGEYDRGSLSQSSMNNRNSRGLFIWIV